MNQNITHNTMHMKAIVMGALMFVVSFSFGSIANAEEDTSEVSNPDNVKPAQLLELKDRLK